MSAFNWILIVSTCPVCGDAAELRCQTHIASDYDGDGRGRFCNREYRLGEQMWWWPRDDERFDNWRVDGRIAEMNTPDYDEECCYSTCTNCEASLYVVIQFHENIPEQVLAVGKEEDWPEEYTK